MLREIEAVANVLTKSRRLLLPLHEAPDGDSIGSTLGLAIGLRGMGKAVTVVGLDPVPQNYAFLPGAGQIEAICKVMNDSYDAIVYLDFAEPSRIGRLGDGREALVEGSKKLVVINIDHHVTNQMFGDLNLVDPQAAATAELVYDILKQLPVAITPEIATCLYTGIVTDTGAFCYENTTPKALRVAAHLAELGANPHQISQHVYGARPISQIKLLAAALNTLKLSADGKIAWMQITSEMLQSANAKLEDTEGVVNYARDIDGVKLGILFREANGKVKVSFRSRGVDCTRIAKAFGGGGHPAAAGCWVEGGLASVEQLVLEVADRVIRETQK